jgi:nifR3 family TIM-barrel protein
MEFHESEKFRALQLFGNSEEDFTQAIRIIGSQNRADHIDLNFGCPVPKVTRRGGGAAIPLHRQLLRKILKEARRETLVWGMSLSAKFRIGIDDEHITYKDSCQIAEAEGVNFITLHARTAQQYYGGKADWSVFENALKLTNMPMYLNGDIFSAADAHKLYREIDPKFHNRVGIACARGVLGYPWIFSEIDDALKNNQVKRSQISFSQVKSVMDKHLQLLIKAWDNEAKACADFRKHTAYYLKGFNIGSEKRSELSKISSSEQYSILMDLLKQQDPQIQTDETLKRGKTKSFNKVHLPYNWLATAAE